MKIPIIIPVFNQLTYLRNLINWWRWYQGDAPIFIVDNKSTYGPLLEFYKTGLDANTTLYLCTENNFIQNMTRFVNREIKGTHDYFVISDPDIQPHPSTPPNFLEVWKNYIDTNKFHRAGFNLITRDLPPSLNEREMIIGNEAELLKNNEVLVYNGFVGYRAPIDTTFCLYSMKNGGWSAPMKGRDWGNCLRLFEAYHFGWYQFPEFVNEEMDFYFKQAKYRVPGEASAGKNNNRPSQYQ